MAESVLFRIEIDNEDAKKALAELQEGASQIGGEGGGRVGGISDKLGMMMRGVGIALGASAAWSLTGPLASSTNTVIGEVLGEFGAKAEKALLGDAGPEALASARAREETWRLFGMQMGMNNVIPQGAVDYYNGRKQLNSYEEKGRQMAETDPRFRATEELINKATDRIVEAIKEAPDEFAAGFFGIGGAAIYKMFK